MKIKEVSDLTGLTKKAINYYEEQGLITPAKTDNGYREYTENDISKLEKIAFYRKLDISIKEIKKIMHNEDNIFVLKQIIEEKRKEEAKIRKHREYLQKILNEQLSKKMKVKGNNRMDCYLMAS